MESLQRSRLKLKGLHAFLRQALWPRCFPKIAKLPLCETGSNRSNPVPKSTQGVEAQRCSNAPAASAVGSRQETKVLPSEPQKGPCRPCGHRRHRCLRSELMPPLPSAQPSLFPLPLPALAVCRCCCCCCSTVEATDHLGIARVRAMSRAPQAGSASGKI